LESRGHQDFHPRDYGGHTVSQLEGDSQLTFTPFADLFTDLFYFEPAV
jgi:hypothetical protein